MNNNFFFEQKIQDIVNVLKLNFSSCDVQPKETYLYNIFEFLNADIYLRF